MVLKRINLLILIVLMTITTTVSFAEETTIHVIDVGNGDAVLIQNNESNILIDAGPDRNSTVSYLIGHNITDIDLFLTTSLSPDKTGGILEVMNRTVVHEYRDFGVPEFVPSYHRVTDRIKNESIPYSSLVPGDVIPMGGDGTIEVVLVNQTDTRASEAILKITIGKISMLLLSKDGAPDMQLKGPVQILRAADHGSREGYDARFVQSIKPDVAIISVGREGSGPNKATIMGLEAAGAEIYQTDIRGTILIHTDGTTYNIGSSRSSSSGSISLITVIETRQPE